MLVLCRSYNCLLCAYWVNSHETINRVVTDQVTQKPPSAIVQENVMTQWNTPDFGERDP